MSVWFRDMMCSDPSMELGTCEMIEPQTILGKDTTYATVSNLSKSKVEQKGIFFFNSPPPPEGFDL